MSLPICGMTRVAIPGSYVSAGWWVPPAGLVVSDRPKSVSLYSFSAVASSSRRATSFRRRRASTFLCPRKSDCKGAWARNGEVALSYPYAGRICPSSISRSRPCEHDRRAHRSTKDLLISKVAVCALVKVIGTERSCFLKNSFYGREWLVDFNMFFIDDLSPALRPFDRSFDPEIDLIVSGQPVNGCMQRSAAARSCKGLHSVPPFSAPIYTKQGRLVTLRSHLHSARLFLSSFETARDPRRSASVLSRARVASFMSEYQSFAGNCRIFRGPRSRTLKF